MRVVIDDTNVGHQQNLGKFDLAIVLIHPRRLVVEQITPLIQAAVAAFPAARKHAVTVIGAPNTASRAPRASRPKHGPSSTDG